MICDEFKEQFLKELRSLKDYLDFIEYINKFPNTWSTNNNAGTVPQQVSDFINRLSSISTQKKIFEYRSVVISLYGIIERTVEKSFERVVASISEICRNYSELSLKAQSEHLKKSLALINIVHDKTRDKFKDLEVKKLLQNLYVCIYSNKVLLNHEAYLTAGNYNDKKIKEIFNHIDVNYTKINKKELDFKLLDKALDDVVNMRHDVAHGVNKDEILAPAALIDKIDKIQEYFLLFFHGVNLSLNFKKLNIKCDKFVVNQVYPRRSVIAFKAKNIQIFTGQKISIIPKVSWDIVEVEILGIHKKLKSGKIKQYNSLKINSETEISLRACLKSFS